MATCPLAKNAMLSAIIAHQGVLGAKHAIESLIVPIDELGACTKGACAFWNPELNRCGQSQSTINLRDPEFDKDLHDFLEEFLSLYKMQKR